MFYWCLIVVVFQVGGGGGGGISWRRLCFIIFHVRLHDRGQLRGTHELFQIYGL